MATDLVPITRPFLSTFYDQFPFEPLSSDVQRLTHELEQWIGKLQNAGSSVAEGSGRSSASTPQEVPHKIDENLWRHREQIEEIINLLQNSKQPSTATEDASSPPSEALEHVEKDLKDALDTICSFQTSTTEKVAKMVGTFLPQDFRGTLIQAQRERSERRKQAEVEGILKNGGTIAQKYQLLWKQQMERRQMLAALGNASGAFNLIVTYLAGVPQILLDFIKTINDHNGPMEEQRVRYGPPLYSLTSLIMQVRLFLQSWWNVKDRQKDSLQELTKLLKDACAIYRQETLRFLAFITTVFDKSPFLITADEAKQFENNAPVEDFKEHTVNRGETFEVNLKAEAEGTMVAWKFDLNGGGDIGFSVEFVDQQGMKLPMLPYKRYESHEGHFFSLAPGTYNLKWDNSYSTFYRKFLRYKADAVPPVASTSEVAEPAEEQS